ncbi:hypothetical protein [Piscirickettsia litoralis]|uniref:Nicotinamide riboside transporter PnuC n=1 Tax=Piscirickettsia litoralis TaxID=1891921 RepID=A0ABX3A5E1_9GAMM|nr:hypothetical protein [Piscirickettsia litoralis]ODN44074.1 hypothetical protein BGC07_10675 [Piscirickettsia litoralis]
MLPEWVNVLGYIMSLGAMTGAYLVARRIPLWAFLIWSVTNLYEFWVASFYYHNVWMSVQFGFFFLNSLYGIYSWKKHPIKS